MNKPAADNRSSSSPSVWRLLKSAVAAAFGVQSKENLQADFSQTSPLPFIIIGVVFTVIFVFGLIGVVSLVI